MDTKKLQLVGTINADTLDGKHANEFASASDVSVLEGYIGGSAVSEQINAAISNKYGLSSLYIENDGGAASGVNNINKLSFAGGAGVLLGLDSVNDSGEVAINIDENTLPLPTATTSTKGGVILSSSTSSTSNSGYAATPSAVKAAYDLANTANTAAATAQSTANGKAPTSHASSATTYGAATSSNYGHVKLSDSTSSSSAASAGIAASPKAVKSAYDLASLAIDTRLNGYRIIIGSFGMPFATTQQSVAVNFGITFASKPAVVCSQVFNTNNVIIRDDNISTTGFTATTPAGSSSGTRTVWFIAIGKA